MSPSSSQFPIYIYIYINRVATKYHGTRQVSQDEIKEMDAKQLAEFAEKNEKNSYLVDLSMKNK